MTLQIKRAAMRPGIPAIAFAIFLAPGSAWSAEPIVGRWLLSSQEVNGQKTSTDELMLRVNPNGRAFEFSYSVPVNDIQFVSLRFAAKLDGTEAEVTNGSGRKIGAVRITKTGAAQYKVVLEGPGRPTAAGAMTVSADGKTLKSESESRQERTPGAIRTVQYFSRQ
jgi:hypothetical protein